MKLASVHHVFFQENCIFLAISILSDNGFLFTLLFDVKFETSEQEMRHVSKCPFFVSHTCADEEKTDKNIQKQVKTFILLPYPNLTKREEHHPEHRNFNHTTIFFRHELPLIDHE